MTMQLNDYMIYEWTKDKLGSYAVIDRGYWSVSRLDGTYEC